MSIVQRAIILALGLVPLASTGLGCSETDTDSLEMGAYPYSEPLAGGGSTGTNGLVSLDYQTFDHMVGIAMNRELVSGPPGSNVITNAAVIDYLLSGPEGKIVFQYAAGCALRDGEMVVYGGFPYFGQGHMLTTGSWLNAPLSGDARLDLLACMVAHVNPTGLQVQILLSGENVSEDGGDHSAYTVDEALWLAVEDGPAENTQKYADEGIHYYVWPLPAFEQACEHNALDALTERVCGQDPATCGLVPRTDRATHCVANVDGHYLCDGKPAIKTTLSREGFVQLYGTGICLHH